jgi:subtilisin-like proprotein convertase family protein
MRHLDEPAVGNWSLQVADNAPVHTGSFQSWTLVIHGR